MNAILSAVFCFLAAALLVRLLATSSLSKGALDIPNDRSLHVIPVPRTGGLGLLGAAALGWLLFPPGEWTGLLAIVLLLSGVAFVDDRMGLPVRTRFVVQVAATTAFLAVYFSAPLLLLPLAFGAVLWMANLYNFMDGSDGLAGGMTVAGFGTYAVAAVAGDAPSLAVVAASIGGAAGGFLVWNFHKASVFLGDSGSVPLGFLSAALGLIGWQNGVWPVWFPALVFSPFIADATVTLIKRFRRGEKLTQAHKTHYYQRALRMGLGHRGTALASYALMGAAGASALAARTWSGAAVLLLLALWGATYAALMIFIDRRWEAFSRNPARAG